MTDLEASVVAAFGQRGIVEFPDGIQQRFLVRGRRLRPVCGDRVVVSPRTGAETAIVVALRTRSNALARETGRQPAEVIAANIEQLIVVCASAPEPDFFIVDRYLCASELMGSKPVVVWNKVDLVGGEPDALDDYRRIGYPVLRVAANSGAGLPELRTLVEAGTSVIVGQSGVGKSSLINALCGAGTANTAALSASTGEGRHTTTASVFHRIGRLGGLVDTPGVRDFIPYIGPGSKRADGFPEIRRAAVGCRFADCRHLREPDCAVKAALMAGSISPRRYESYRRLCA